MAENKSSTLNFGTAIAFVAPGFLAFKALSYYSASAHGWLEATANKDQSVGVFLLVLLGSTALGIGVSGIRALLIDNLFYSRRLKKWSIPRPRIAWNRLNEVNQQGLNAVTDGYYRYYQFYSNALIAFLILLAARLSVPPNPAWTVLHWLAIVGIPGSLLWSAHDSFRKYSTAVNDLFSTTSRVEGT